MESINIWDISDRISVKIKNELYNEIKTLIYQKYQTQRKVYDFVKDGIEISFATFHNILKDSYCRENFFVPLRVWLSLCKATDVDLMRLQKNIVAYKNSNGPNYVSNPILPVKITPIFDMIISHNIADGTVINPGKGRLPYFGYRQFDSLFRELYIKKLEAIFGKINFPNKYYTKSTRPYCPPVLASLFFKIYDLDVKSFLSKTARIPREILNKDKEYLLAVLIAFVIDEGNVDSTAIVIKLKNISLAQDLYKISQKLGYKSKLTSFGEYGNLYILREGMKLFFKDYKVVIKKYPEMSLGKIELKIENGLKIYNRPIYKSPGNKEHILNLLKEEDLTVNQIALRINMTRQGVRFHIKNLEKENLLLRNGFQGEKNIVYSTGGRRCLSV
ncbi:MAG: winged helix-turn-helix domain-containing protein [Nanoarchaeota archaeon]